MNGPQAINGAAPCGLQNSLRVVMATTNHEARFTQVHSKGAAKQTSLKNSSSAQRVAAQRVAAFNDH